MSTFGLWMIFIVVVFAVMIGYIVSNVRDTTILDDINMTSILKNGNILLVIAHPDDESMFFTPLLINKNINIHLLCLSNGNADGIGQQREMELYNVAQNFFKIKRKYITIINDGQLKDSMSMKWDHNMICNYVTKYVNEWNINVLITFDEYGISKHTNHIDTYYGCSLIKNDKLIKLKLNSHGIFRKFSFFIEPFFLLFFKIKYKHKLIVLTQPHFSYKAMTYHKTQFIWFRKLFILFSQYSSFNVFQIF